jgi:alginate O-acetyltransferase complex protein AlgJ
MSAKLWNKQALITKTIFPLVFVFFSLVPLVLSADTTCPAFLVRLAGHLYRAPLIGLPLRTADEWIQKTDQPVQELRPLASFPSQWKGSWFDVDKNYALFEKWFSDNLGLRNVMIRVKNELDYRLFHSSTRVYFGKGDQIYGRHLIDVELPSTEAALDTSEKIDAVYRGVVKLSDDLKAIGITTVFVTPMMKEYFIPGQLPFFAPRLPANSNFMRLYDRMKASPELHFVDVYQIIKSIQPKYQIFYKQDFHWTNTSALEVAKASTDMLADLTGSATRWQHPVVTKQTPFLGSDAQKDLARPAFIYSIRSENNGNRV